MRNCNIARWTVIFQNNRQCHHSRIHTLQHQQHKNVDRFKTEHGDTFCVLVHKYWVTFPLTSCSTMFSGLRSLCMILFSCKYWMPEPVYKDHSEISSMQTHNWYNYTQYNSGVQYIPTSLSRESTSLSFSPQQFSGLLSICQIQPQTHCWTNACSWQNHFFVTVNLCEAFNPLLIQGHCHMADDTRESAYVKGVYSK